jgi:hypothetical protein
MGEGWDAFLRAYAEGLGSTTPFHSAPEHLPLWSASSWRAVSSNRFDCSLSAYGALALESYSWSIHALRPLPLSLCGIRSRLLPCRRMYPLRPMLSRNAPSSAFPKCSATSIGRRQPSQGRKSSSSNCKNDLRDTCPQTTQGSSNSKACKGSAVILRCLGLRRSPSSISRLIG